MNIIKIINNNVNGKSDGENYFQRAGNSPSPDSYAIRVISDGYATTSPKIVINGNSISGSFTSGIRSVNNSTINENKIDGNFTSYGIYCLQDSNVESNKISANCQTSIYTTVNGNISNNSIKGFTQYGIRAAGKNISENIISRNDGQDIQAFIAGGTNNGTANNQVTLVVDNVFSHDTVDGLDNDVVKNATNWKVERNLPNYVISTPIINIRTVRTIEDLANLTEVAHNEVAVVSGNKGDDPATSSYGVWKFSKDAVRADATLLGTEGNAAIKSNDNSGYWYWSDFARLNSPLGMPRLDLNGYLELSTDRLSNNKIGIPKINVKSTGSIDVSGGNINVSAAETNGKINIESGGILNIKSGGTLNIERGAIVNSGTKVKVLYSVSQGQNIDIRLGTDSWAEEYVIGGENDCTLHIRCDGIENLENYVGTKIKFSKLISSTAGKVAFINAYTSNNQIQASVRDFVLRHRDYDAEDAPDNNKWVWWLELMLIPNASGDTYFWHPSAWTNWVSNDDVLQNGA